MEHIQLLTIEAFLEAKREIIENVGYNMEELHIDCAERIIDFIKEIMEEYFINEKVEKEMDSVYINYKQKGNCYEVGVSNECGKSTDTFLRELENYYSEIIQEGREGEIVEEIKRVLSKVYTFSSQSLAEAGLDNRVYKIIKYTLSEEKRCDYLDNGNFIGEMNEEDIFPFEKKKDTLPIYCQEMQRVLFGVHRRIFLNPCVAKESSDITKFSFYNVKKIVDEVTEKLVNSKEDDKGYHIGYIEGAEDYILLDEILGISLTNIIYWKTKEIEEREVQDRIIELVPSLARCQDSIARNAVVQVLLDYLKATEYNKTIMRKVGQVLKKEVKRWNEYYEEVEAVGLCPVFSYLRDCSIDDLMEACKSVEDELIWNEYIYMNEIEEDNEMIKVKMEKGHEKEDKIRTPIKNMNRRTWYAYIHKTVFNAIWN